MSAPAIRNYLRAAAASDPAGSSDAELLARFAASRDEDAFELLVWRHAGLVQRVCRAVLRDHHAAEDAAQAAFFVLARKAGSIRRGTVVGWLYRVARRVAVRQAKQRARMPEAVPELDRVPDRGENAADRGDLAIVCAEIDRLPERYRVPVLLCFFEGLTHTEAARRTGWPVGTVAGRLARAKEILARRLLRRGVGLPAAVFAPPAAAFVGPTAQAAAAFAQRKPIVPGIDPSIPKIAEGVLQAMTPIPMKLTAAAAVLVCSLAAGVWASGGPGDAPPVVVPEPPAPVEVAAPAPAPPQHPVCDLKQRAISLNHLKQILIAFHNYTDVNGHFPGDVTDKNGKPLLSWRVLLLPYLEETPLYNRFKLDEPWDSENNKKLLAQMPAIYRVGIEPKDSVKTYYQGFAGPGTIFEPGKKLKFTSVTDGTSNTLCVVEAGPPVEWTKPADIPYDPKKPLPKLDGPFRNVLNCTTTDGAAHSLKPDINQKTLRLLIERDDGNPIGNLKDLSARFALTGKELAAAAKALETNGKFLEQMAAELQKQQKLIEKLGGKGSEAAPLEETGAYVDRLGSMSRELERALEDLRAKTEQLRKEVDKAGKK